jgi:hypothetical protein
LKVLVGVAPNGAITFVSDMFPGRITDRQLVEESGILDRIRPGDNVMADRGFDIEDILKKKNAK